jgi:hypothetical protein
MFLTLLISTFIISLIVSGIVERVFDKSIDSMLRRIIADPISKAWSRYLKFAIYVVGISSGVRIWDLERYLNPELSVNRTVLTLTTERWILEIYRTIIGTLQGLAWLLLIFFIFALLAFVIIRVFELRNRNNQSDSKSDAGNI